MILAEAALLNCRAALYGLAKGFAQSLGWRLTDMRVRRLTLTEINVGATHRPYFASRFAQEWGSVMTIARIFAPLTGTDDTWAVANVVCDLASRFHAHVTAQYVKLNPTPYDYFAPLGSSATLPYAAILSAAETNEERARV